MFNLLIEDSVFDALNNGPVEFINKVYEFCECNIDNLDYILETISPFFEYNKRIYESYGVDCGDVLLEGSDNKPSTFKKIGGAVRKAWTKFKKFPRKLAYRISGSHIPASKMLAHTIRAAGAANRGNAKSALNNLNKADKYKRKTHLFDLLHNKKH